jgi:hypothetical protein
MRFDQSKRTFLLKKYYKLGSYRSVQKAWRTEFKNEKAPCLKTIKLTVQRFENTGSVASLPPIPIKPNEKREEAKNQLKILYEGGSSLSLRKAAQIAGISHVTVLSILKEDLHLKPYKIHEWHKLEDTDYQKRVDFANFFGGLPKNALQFLICCDEAYFYLTSPINKQNDRIWSESKPSDKIERPLHDDKVLVWCAISCGRLYGPYFFDTAINQHNYLHMLQNFFWKRHCQVPEFQKYYFAQDGATPHTASIVQDYLKSKLSARFIDKEKWPPRSPNLNPCDFFLWGYLKDRVYNPMPDSIDSLKANIEREFKNITKGMLKSVFDDFEKRLDLVRSLKGGHVENK